MSDRQLEKLQRDVQYLMDRLAIQDCIARHARGHDRHDSDMITETYWADGIDEHGNIVNPASKYAAWANAIHEASSHLHTHNITTQSCEIDGDVAHCESYVIVGLLAPDAMTASYISGRYVDRLERRDGEWKIAVRRCTLDLMVTGDASMLKHPALKEQAYPKGTWDKRDLSYQRPLTVKSPTERW